MQDAALALMFFSGLVALVASLRFIAPPPLRVWLLNHTYALKRSGFLLGIVVLAYMAYSVLSVYR